MLIGGLFFGILCPLAGFGLVPPYLRTERTVVLIALYGALGGALLFGAVHGIHWVYYHVPTVRKAASGGVAVGMILGGGIACAGALTPLFQGRRADDPLGVAYLGGIAGAWVGFLIGWIIGCMLHVYRRRRKQAEAELMERFRESNGAISRAKDERARPEPGRPGKAESV
jgi:hypothetical protein